MAFLGIGKKKVIDYTEKYNNRVDSIALGKGKTALRRLSQNPVSSEIQAMNQPSSSQSTNSASNVDGFGFFGFGSSNSLSSQTNSGLTSTPPSSFSDSDYLDTSSNANAEEKRQKLAKRLITMTEQIEDLNNQVYHLTQRLEVLEKKLSLSDRY